MHRSTPPQRSKWQRGWSGFGEMALTSPGADHHVNRPHQRDGKASRCRRSGLAAIARCSRHIRRTIRRSRADGRYPGRSGTRTVSTFCFARTRYRGSSESRPRPPPHQHWLVGMNVQPRTRRHSVVKGSAFVVIANGQADRQIGVSLGAVHIEGSSPGPELNDPRASEARSCRWRSPRNRQAGAFDSRMPSRRSSQEPTARPFLNRLIHAGAQFERT